MYKSSSPTDTIALNQVRAKRQDLIVAWQQDFDRLPKPRLSQSDVLNKNAGRASAFGSVRIWPRRYNFDFPYAQYANMSEAEEYGSPSTRRLTVDSTMSASETSEASGSESAAEPVKSPRPLLEPGNEVKATAVGSPTTETKDPDSDSTIGAPVGNGVQTAVPDSDIAVSLRLP